MLWRANSSMSATNLTETLFALPVAERIALADKLYASVPEEWQAEADRVWLEEAERRSEEMSRDPTAELSHEAFLAGIQLG